MNRPSLAQIRKVMAAKGYKFYETGNYNFNIIGIRADNRRAGQWDDLFVLAYKVKGEWKLTYIEGTTDPGQTGLKNPSFLAAIKHGTAIMAEGQYIGLWKLGKHRGWDAFVQKGRVRLYRDKNRDDIIDKDPKTLGWYGWETGINFHPFWGKRKFYDLVYNWSEGCQAPRLHADSDEWKAVISDAKIAKSIWGDSFTFTLLDESDFAAI